CGYAQFAPPDSFANAQAYALSLFPTSPDAILLTCLFIQKEFRGRGLGFELLQAVLLNLQQRGYSALESYGRDDSANNCSGPTQFLVHQGFHPVRQGSWEGISFSLVRRDLAPSPPGQ
ncbi:MAG: GNAT family N-acetyltransferase, partial [Coprothermobacterota bacterium]|nr:GNAT family N-acetyltransferase [Coprothermobacterota bacterium]